MRKVVSLLILISSVTYGGFDQTGIGARARALGGSYVGLSDDVWGIFFNAAGLSTIAQPAVSFLYVPSQFGLTELRYGAVAAATPVGNCTLGVGVRSYGFELYRECTGSLASAFSYSTLSFGITLNCHTASIRNYGSAATIGIDVGVKATLADRFCWGIAAKNINSPTIGVSHEQLPQVFTSGILYHPTGDVNLVVDYELEPGYDPSPRFGFEYWIVPQLALRAGMSDQPTRYAAGMGVKISRFQVDYAMSDHQELGWTHEASITIR
jgi:hypothetical protein